MPEGTQEDAAWNDGVLSVAFGALAWLTMLSSFFLRGPDFTLLFLPAFALAGLAIFFGARGVSTAAALAGDALGRSLAVLGLVLGIVHLGAMLLIPLLLLLLALVFGCRTAWYPYPTCGAPPPEEPPRDEGCCDGCCDGCCEGCGDCGCGSCGDCGCGGNCGGCGGCGGGCGCATLALSSGALTSTGSLPLPLALDRAFAHHPDHPGYREDVYRVRGVRLCVGCFTTFPLFLLGTALLLVLPPLLPWWAWLAGGAAGASAQALSSAGLARRRWQKALVKTLLGLGLAAFLHGVLQSPWPKAAQAGALLAALLLAMLSTLPRARRMRKARQAAGCRCEARERPA